MKGLAGKLPFLDFFRLEFLGGNTGACLHYEVSAPDHKGVLIKAPLLRGPQAKRRIPEVAKMDHCRGGP